MYFPNLLNQCRSIVDKIEKENFEIYDIIIKYMTKEEVTNLFYKHVKKEYFHEILEYMMT